MINNKERFDQTKNDRNLILKKKIENAIRDSLDPLSAQRALESLHPLLLDLSGPDNRQRQSYKSLNQKERQQQQLSNHIYGKDSCAQKKCDHRVTLPSIQTILEDYRKVSSRSLGVHTLPRCSVSEPIPVLEMFDQRSSNLISPIDSTVTVKRQDHRQREHQSQNKIDAAQQMGQKNNSYDADAAISLLRLERTTRRTDFSTFWDWRKNKLNPDPDGMKNATGELHDNNEQFSLSKTADGSVKGMEKVEKESKVERVKRMQQAYMTHAPDESTELITNGSIPQPQSSAFSTFRSSEHNHSYVDNYSATSVEYDEDETLSGHRLRHTGSHVTDSEIISISKYFSTSNDSHRVLRKNEELLLSPNNVVIVEKMTNCGNQVSASPYIVEGASSAEISTRESHDIHTTNIPIIESRRLNNIENISSVKRDSECSSSLSLPPPTVPHSTISPISKSKNSNSPKERFRIALRPIKTPCSRECKRESFCDFPSGNNETPTNNDYSVGGLDGLLDWTRNLDIDVV